jgi:hypothetical protein
MQITNNKRHIETEKKFYKIMNKKRTFLLTLFIVGIGTLLLLYQIWLFNNLNSINSIYWLSFIVILFISQLLIGQFIFEIERKKYT